MRLFRAWAAQRGLDAVEAAYVARNPQRSSLQFSRSGDASVERAYRTHWVSPALSDAQRARMSEPPELVVIQPLDAWTCHRCGGGGGLLIMEPAGPSCLACAGLGELVFLPAGDAALSRRANGSFGSERLR